jgi:hypothetical protein
MTISTSGKLNDIMSRKTYTESEILALLIKGESLETNKVLGIFASAQNWKQVYVNGKAWWSWIGPVLPPYQLAQRALQ